MDITQRIQSLIEPALTDLGYEVVLIHLSASINPVLKVTIDMLDGTGIGIDDCVSASREISAILDVEDPIENAFSLEVSSPGIERPLTKRAHFERFQGAFIKVSTFDPFESRKRFSGILEGIKGESVVVNLVTPDGGRTSTDLTIVEIPMNAISNAKISEYVAVPQKPKKPIKKTID